MGKRSAVVELFLGDMGSIQRELRPSTQREDQLTMKTKLKQIAVKAVNQLPKSVVREIRTPRSVGAGGGRPPPATRWARRNPRPYRDPGSRLSASARRSKGRRRESHRGAWSCPGAVSRAAITSLTRRDVPGMSSKGPCEMPKRATTSRSEGTTTMYCPKKPE